jgi:hypothetical protein
VRGKLSQVVEVRKGAVAPSPERGADQVIGQVRVLRQQASVQIRAEHAALKVAFGSV